MAVDQDKLNAFLGKAVGDIGAAMSANMVLLGDKLGLYKAMAKMGAVTPPELAKGTKTTERYIREWLGNQAAGGYVAYDPATGRYALPEEQAIALADESSPLFSSRRLSSNCRDLLGQSQNRAAVQDRKGPRMGPA
ncbi:hypothetical protein [Petrachloros mirabilis]|nr:hypothetical protein [Nitrospira sp.]